MIDMTVVGYGKQKKISVTGAISDVPVANLQRIATPSLSNALAGSMPGIVTRQTSGEPGWDGGQIFIRGFGTWLNRSPLILVDGVERDINILTTEEIADFTILKDASATAVYGVKGANGVILITTKRGKIGKPRITFRSESAILTALRMPKYINGFEYASLVNEALTNENKPVLYPDEELAHYKNQDDPYFYPDVDWVNTILKKNTSQTINNLSVSGGSETVRYYTNIGYTVENGIYKQAEESTWDNNAKIKRYNFRSNVDIDLSKSLKINLGIGGFAAKGNFPMTSSANIFDAIKKSTPISYPVVNPDSSIAGGASSLNNPYGLVSRSGYVTQDWHTLQSTFGATWDLSRLVTKGLSLRGLFSYDYRFFAWHNRNKPYAIRQVIGQEPDGEYIYRVPDLRVEAPMGYSWGNNSQRTYYGEASINYDRSFGKHHVGGMILFNANDFVNISAGTSQGNLPYRRNGLAARATYDYEGRYLLEYNMGYNGSENFPPGKQYGFFPSGSAGWVVSNEKFWNVPFINSLKFRGSLGQVGNDAIGGRRFLFLSTFVRGGDSYFFGDNQGLYPSINESLVGNPNVTWEVATKMDIGIDMRLLENRITIQFDYFRENRDGILLQRATIPLFSGYRGGDVPFGNLGGAKNHGVDGLLELKLKSGSGIDFGVRANLTYAVSVRTKDDIPPFLFPYQNPINSLIDQKLGYVALGIFQNEKEIAESPKQTFVDLVQPGDIKYMDTNGDGVIDIFDRVRIGYPRTPQLVYGVNFYGGFKGFEISLFFQGVAKASTFVDGEGMWPFILGLGTYNIFEEYYNNRWTPDNPDAKYPRVSTMNNPNNIQTSTLYLRDASYIRFKSAEIAYNFDKIKKLDEWGVKGLRLFVNGTNLITWDQIKFIDPEANFGTGSYPLQRIINFGVQAKF